MYYVSCIMYPVLCIMYHVLCIMYYRLDNMWLPTVLLVLAGVIGLGPDSFIYASDYEPGVCHCNLDQFLINTLLNLLNEKTVPDCKYI